MQKAAGWKLSPETEAELRDAFQFSHGYSYVSRAWVENLLAAEYERGHCDGWKIGRRDTA
jgi:hypothetical protein